MPAKVIIGKGGLPAVHVENSAATAQIMLLGAHLISYKPVGANDMTWYSGVARFQEGIAIRGGIPICWPWFSKNTEHPDYPMHGIARTANWHFDGATENGDASTTVAFSLKDSPATRQFFPFAFLLQAIFTVGKTLTVELKTTNLDAEPFTITQALHTYFKVADVEKIAIDGFDGKPYINTVGGANTPGVMPVGAIKIAAECDSDFLQAPGPFRIVDPVLDRVIGIQTEGSKSAVVWNPWIEKSKRMSDYAPSDYHTMVCVETCNLKDDARTVAPGKTHTLKAVYSF